MWGEKTPAHIMFIPTYNRAHLAGRAIQSVLAQTYQGRECLVVDDASTVNTVEKVRSFQDPHTHSLPLGASQGAPAEQSASPLRHKEALLPRLPNKYEGP